MIIIKCLFWLSSVLVIYPFVGYPLILYFNNRFQRRARPAQSIAASDVVADAMANEASAAAVTLIISAYNEESVIERKLRNASQLDYPEQLLDIIVVSDGSSDDTNAIVKAYAVSDPRVRLLTLETQSGKTAGLNKAVPLARGDIIVFSDANAMYAPDALHRLLEPFDDPAVGYSVGSALYSENEDGAVNESEGLYWKYELWIKKLESEFFSVVGGDGAIYAIRRELYRPLEKIDISDFVNPLQIIAAGYKGVFLPGAISYENGTREFSDEFKRKRRIVNRSWGAVRRNTGLFSLSRNKRFLFMLFSHKVIRWWSLAFITMALLSAMFLFQQNGGALYFWLFTGIATTVLIGIIGSLMDRAGREMPKFVYLIYYFYLVALASLLGIVDDFRGLRQFVWTHSR